MSQPKTVPSPPSFTEHFERSVQLVRGALTDLLADVGADPSAPQVVSRRFGVNRNLAWKTCKIVNTADPYQVPQHLSGAAGFEILFEALVRAGAREATVRAARAALAEFEAMTALHAGDRPTLERMLGSMRPERVDPPLLEAGRRAAFEGNTSIFGVRARLRMGVHVIAPSAEFPGRLDVGIVGGLLGFRRLRPDAVWPLTQEQHGSDEPDGGPRRVEPIAPDARPGEAPLIPEFCSSPVPPIDAIPTADSTIFELREGPVGNTAALDCVFGWILRGFGQQHKSEHDDRGEYFLRLNTPAEHLLFDVLLHRDLPFQGDPAFDLFGLMHGRMELPVTTRPRFRLPRTSRVEALGSPPVLSTSHAPRHVELVRTITERLDCGLDEFRGYRVSLAYPPSPTLAIYHYPLPVASDGPERP